MKLTQVPNLRIEDFQSEQSWIGRLFIQLNPFIQSISQALDRNIDYETNIKSVTKDYTITVSQFQPFDFQWPYKDQSPVDLRICKALKGTQLTPTILLPAWQYDATDLSIGVTNILEATTSGISALSGRYQFTLRVSV